MKLRKASVDAILLQINRLFNLIKVKLVKRLALL
jgi:hypothetical protein